jgi:hypothetical protein
MRNMKTMGMAALVLVALAPPSAVSAGRTSQSFDYYTIDVPCSACPGGIARRTALGGINPAGDIVGTYTDAVGGQHGFLLSRGQFTTIDVPGELAGVAGSLPTIARGIGPSGEIVGQYTAPVSSAPFGSPAYCPKAGSAACTKGFLYSRGEFFTVLFPGHPGTVPGRIRPDGSMYGCFHDFDVMASMFSASWTRSGTTSIAAGGGELTDPTLSFPNSMHGGVTPDGRTVVGFYTDMMTGRQHGYVLQNGVLEPYDVPLSSRTVIWDINPAGEMVGTYDDANGRRHGFFQARDGSATIAIDYPGAVATVAMGMNAAGVIVGQYTDTSGRTHGLVVISKPGNGQ